MPVWIITPGQNPEAPGEVSFGIEGDAPVFVLDSDGNLTIAGALVAAGGGGGGGDVTLATEQTFTATKTWLMSDVNDPTQVLQAAATGQVADVLQAYSGTDTGEGGARQRTTYLNEKGELRVISAKGNSVAVRVKGQPTQSVNIFEITDTSNNMISRADSAGHFRSATIGQCHTWGMAGDAELGVSASKVRNITGVAQTFLGASVQVGTAPTGAALTVDVLAEGASILTADLTVAAGATESAIVTSFADATWAAGEDLTVEITGIGSGTVGADVVVQVYVG
jgi:hypothetical protein